MRTKGDLSRPTLTYVGRVKDSRKGIEVFFDALEILWADRGDDFKARIVGGNEEDIQWLELAVASRPILCKRAQRGQIEIWGRVENEALPEIYSRSLAIVIPSFREQFGIVAIEAMMCGCPVIASRVGGLQDIVVHNRTGTLFDRGNSCCLASIIDSYVQSPSLPLWLGKNAQKWARQHFDSSLLYKRFSDLLRGSKLEQMRQPNCETLFLADEIRKTLPVVETMLTSKVSDARDLTSSQSLSFYIKTDSAMEFFVKEHSSRPTYFSCLHGAICPERHQNLPRERVILAEIIAKELDLAPEVVASDPERGLVVQEWLETGEAANIEDLVNVTCTLVERLQKFPPSPSESQLSAELSQVRFDERAENSDLFDSLGAEAHAHLFEGALRARRIHPQIELLRIRKYLHRSHWLPLEYRTRALAVISLLTVGASPAGGSLRFGHGSLKAEHLLKKDGNWMLCDFDHAGYFYGPIDIAHCIWNWFELTGGVHPHKILSTLSTVLSDDTELFLATCWVAAFRLNKDIIFLSRGQWDDCRKSLHFLFAFNEAYRDSFNEQKAWSDRQLNAIVP